MALRILLETLLAHERALDLNIRDSVFLREAVGKDGRGFPVKEVEEAVMDSS